MRDLSGQRFGCLIAVRPTDMRKNGFVVWECKCDCGNIVFIKRGALTGGTTKSCGCLDKKRKAQGKDLAGQRFGRLTAIRPTAERKRGAVVWECFCDCGVTTFAQSIALKSGNTKSCGCLRRETAGEIHKYPTLTQEREQGHSKGKKSRKNNTSGYPGIGYRTDLGKYTAGIGFQYGNYHLGTYRSIEDAIDVRKKAERLIWNEGDAFYHKWKELADTDACWAKEHPIRFCISKDEERGYIVSFVPEL